MHSTVKPQLCSPHTGIARPREAATAQPQASQRKEAFKQDSWRKGDLAQPRAMLLLFFRQASSSVLQQLWQREGPRGPVRAATSAPRRSSAFNGAPVAELRACGRCPPPPNKPNAAAQLFTLERVSLDLGMPSVVLSGAQTYTRGDALGSELSAVKHVNILPCFSPPALQIPALKFQLMFQEVSFCFNSSQAPFFSLCRSSPPPLPAQPDAEFIPADLPRPVATPPSP